MGLTANIWLYSKVLASRPHKKSRWFHIPWRTYKDGISQMWICQKYKPHLDRVNEVWKLVSNSGDPPRLSQPISLTPKEEDRAGHFLQFVLWGLLPSVYRSVLLGCGKAVCTKLLCVHSLPKVMEVAWARSWWLVGHNHVQEFLATCFLESRLSWYYITGLAWGHPAMEKRMFCAAGGVPVTRLLTWKKWKPPLFHLAYLAQEVLLEVSDEGIFC